MKCKEHPRYKAIRKPKVKCKDCWKYYREKHPPEKVFHSSVDIPMHFIRDERWDILQTGLRRAMDEVNYYNNKHNTISKFVGCEVKTILPGPTEKLDITFTFEYEEKE